MRYMVAGVLAVFPGWRRLLTVVCLVGVLSPTAVSLAADPQEELDKVQEKLDDARSGLDEVEERKAVELEDLQRLDARRAELDRQLAVLDDRLEVAERELADSQTQLDATTQQLTSTQSKLTNTRKQLAAGKAEFADRARATYMYGGRGSWVSIVAGLDNMADFERGVKYARSVLRKDQERVERIAALETIVQRIAVDLEELQERHAAARAVDAERRNAAAAIVSEHQAVAAQVEAEAAERRRLVATLETDRRSYIAMVQNLEAESTSLEVELRRIAQEQRAAELAAQRKAAAEAEARRLAAVARQKADRPAVVEPPAPAADPDPPPSQPSTSAMLWPSNGPKTSDYGWRTHPIFGTRRFHAGIDIGAGYGAAIYAARDGVVHTSGVMSGYGNTVVIDHGGGTATLYAHQSSLSVSAGQSVSRGDVIGYVGSTGYSTGPHLHFEVRVNGSPTDPMAYF